LEPVYVYGQSRTLSKILTELLLGSNNYVANQIFLEIGGRRLGGPVSLAKSLQVANELLAKHGLAESIHLEEGSGISRGNRFTARGLAELLHLFEPHADLLRRGEGARFKTGTFSGVRTLAGFAETSAWASALRDRAHRQRRRDALPAAASHPVRAVVERLRRAHAAGTPRAGARDAGENRSLSP
jgi:D-alanyl-D-alanine carboxypeptidase